MSFQTYSKTKHSKTNSWNSIPDHWNEVTISTLKQMQYILNFQDGNHGELHPKGEDFVEKGITFLTAKSIDENGQIDFDNAHKLSEDFCQTLRIGFTKANDVLFTHNATVGRVGIMPFDAPDSIIGTSITYYRLNQKKISNHFFAYLLKSNYILSQYEPIMKQSTRNQISILKQAKFFTLIPEIEEQKKISEFIDKYILKIDLEIQNNKKLIELLNQKRITTINQTVTKGIDHKVSMKDSKIKEIGKIPKHWNAYALKFILKIPITDGPHTTPKFLKEGIPFISAHAIKNNDINFNNARKVSKLAHEEYIKKANPKKNDLLLIKSGNTTGRLALVNVNFEFSIWSPLALIRVNDNNEPRFYFYYMLSDLFQDQINLKVNWTTQPNLGMGQISDLVVIVPSKFEQKQIVDYLDNKITKINLLELKIKKQIQKLEEFKQVIISYAVTGKICVTN